MGQATSAQNLSGMAAQGNSVSAAQKKDDGVTWWCKILATTCCIVAGISRCYEKFVNLKVFSLSGRPPCIYLSL